MPSRAQYVAARVGARMGQRGEKMLLRRSTISTGPVPFRNPPDVSSDLTVRTAANVGGQAFLGIGGTSVIGRLVAGDQIQCFATPNGLVQDNWLVGVMPSGYQTDSDGVVLVDGTGTPLAGVPTRYTPDARAAENAWPAIAVSAPGNPDPAASIGTLVQIVFQADQVVYGSPLSLTRQGVMGWTETDTIGVRIAAYNNGAIAPPKVDDQLVVGGKTYGVIQIGQTFGNGVQFFYELQLR